LKDDNINFSKYKNSLKSFLSDHGVNTKENPTFCINPEHDNHDTPAMMLYDDYFQCQSCGVHGDIYDACGLVLGITEKIEQFKEIEKHFGGYNPPIEDKKTFTANPAAEKKVYEYLKRTAGREAGVKAYLKQRKCTNEMIAKMWPYFGWWPGYETAEKKLGKNTLFDAGIPGKNPKKGTYSWGPSGPVVKLGTGFKLFYFENNESKKIASKKGRTFPFPKLPKTEEIFLTEGEISALSMRSAGWDNTSAIGGVNGATKETIKEIQEYNKITIVFDGDSAGRKGPWKLKEKLESLGYTGEIIIARLPESKDPDDLIKDGRADELREAIAKAETRKAELIKSNTTEKTPPFIFLGYDDKAYFFMPKNQNIPLKIARGNNSIKNHIEEIATPDWWFSNFKKETRDSGVIFDLGEAMNWLREQSYKRGMFDSDKILGVGPHRDGDKIIINTGKSLLIYNNGEIDYNEYDGNLVFCRSKFKFEIPEKTWNWEDRKNFIYQLNTFNFEKTLDSICIAGFIAVAPFASLLNRCPHIWLTAIRGAGKTFLIDNIIEPALGKFVVKAEGGTSEAGVRQSIGRDCRTVIIDEFEANNKHEISLIEAILGLARSAYGGSDKIKGSAGHEAIRFRTKMMFCFSSVKTYLSNAANSSRIAVVRMNKLPKDAPHIGKLPEMSGIKRLIYDRLKEMLENCYIAKEEIIAAGYDERTGDTYSPLLAGAWMIVSNDKFMRGSDAANAWAAKAISEIKQEEQLEDEERIFSHILQNNVRLDANTSKTIAEMLTEKNEGDINKLRYADQLARIGIRKMKKMINGEEIDVLAMSCRHTEIEKIMSDTAFTEYRDVLSRHKAFIPFGDRKYSVVRMAAKIERVMFFDWDEIESEYLAIGSEENIPF